MKTRCLLFLGSSLALMMMAAPAWSEGIKTGKWEVTIVTKVEGMPDMSAMMGKMPPGFKMPAGMSMSGAPGGGMEIKSTSCVTEANPFPKMKTPPGCDAPQIRRQGDQVDYSMDCNGEKGQTSIKGHITYSDGTMQGSTKTRQVVGGRTINSTADLTGRYLGPC